MNFPTFRSSRSSIANRLSGWFLLMAVIPCVVLLALTLHFSSQALNASNQQRLRLICDAKARQLEDYVGERRSDAQFLMRAPGFVEASLKLNESVKAGKVGNPPSTSD